MHSRREDGALATVLDRLEGVQHNGQGYKALCPAHNDRESSLTVTKGDDERVLLHCFAGCNPERVADALGLSMHDLFPDSGETAKMKSAPSHVGGCTLEEYAEAKGLPLDFLRRLGLSDRRYQGKPAVRIPYHGVDGAELAVRFRLGLGKSKDADDRFRWKSGSMTTLYGLEHLDKIRDAGYCVLVEGETGTQTLLYHKVPVLGIPGASTWKQAWAEYLDGVEKVFLVVEPDRGGETLRDKLSASDVRERLYLVDLGEHKDTSGLYLADQANFRQRFMAALDDATPLIELRRTEAETAARAAWEACAELAQKSDILSSFAIELARCGVAGETRFAKLLYLCVTSRLLDKPVSVAVKGPSSGGKSYLTEQVLRFFPNTTYYALTAMSEHALAYGEEPLSHRMLVIYEAAGMSSDFQSYLIRSLLSEGRVRYETAEKTAEGRIRSRLIEREGPTGLIVTTTAVKLHPENETRLLSLTVTDTNEQTRGVMAALAEEKDDDGLDLTEWHALQEWLQNAEHRVTIPYAKALAEMVPPVAVRLRRDFGAVLSLIRAHAVLHQSSRERDGQGRIVATQEDYAVVRELVADLVSEGIEVTVPATVRKTVEMVFLLHEGFDKPVTVAKLAEELKLDKSAALRRARTAIDRGYLKNLEDRKGRPAQLVPGDPLPEDVEILPSVERLQGCTVASGSEGVKTNFFL